MKQTEDLFNYDYPLYLETFERLGEMYGKPNWSLNKLLHPLFGNPIGYLRHIRVFTKVVYMNELYKYLIGLITEDEMNIIYEKWIINDRFFCLYKALKP